MLVIVAAALLAAAGAFLLLAGGEERAPETTEESPAAPARAPDDASGPAVAPSDEPDGEPFDCGSIPGDALVEGEYPELDCFGEKLLACEPATLTVGEGSEEMLMEVHGRGDAACHVSMGMGSEMLRCPVPVENGGGQSSAELARSAIMALPLMALESSNGCTGNTEFMGAMDDLGTGDTNAGREDVMDSVSGDSCDPREEDCDCETSDDCIVDDELTAAFCRTGGCWVRYAPAAASIEGDGRAFCEAYVNGCQEASLTIAHEGVERTVTIDGPGSFEEEACTLTVSGAGAEVSSGSADRIADSVEACIHNLPVYFYWSLEENIHCCGYDMMYEP